MSGATCTRITVKGNDKKIKKFINDIKKSISIKIIGIDFEETTFETYDFMKIEYVDKLSEKYKFLEFYETLYDLHPDPGHWYLMTTMAKNGLTYHCHRWESQNNPKIYRKKDSKVLDVAYEYMLNNILKEPLPKKEELL